MRESLETMAPPDAPPVFRWWTFGVLIAYTAFLLVFCGVVTVRHYSPALPTWALSMWPMSSWAERRRAGCAIRWRSNGR